jgi:hypothetical protein
MRARARTWTYPSLPNVTNDAVAIAVFEIVSSIQNVGFDTVAMCGKREPNHSISRLPAVCAPEFLWRPPWKLAI